MVFAIENQLALRIRMQIYQHESFNFLCFL